MVSEGYTTGVCQIDDIGLERDPKADSARQYEERLRC